jgi:hypothetical protein
MYSRQTITLQSCPFERMINTCALVCTPSNIRSVTVKRPATHMQATLPGPFPIDEHIQQRCASIRMIRAGR